MENLLHFFENNSIYIVLLIVLTIWGGVFVFLNSLDKRLKQIEKDIKESYNEK